MMFLAIRMLIYVMAVPVAAAIGATVDMDAGTITIHFDSLANWIITGLVAMGAPLVTFVASRFAKVK